MTSFNLSFPEDESNRIVSLATKRGFRSPNEFLERIVSDALKDRLEGLLEQKILEAKQEETTEWTDDDWTFIRTEGRKLAEKLRAEKR